MSYRQNARPEDVKIEGPPLWWRIKGKLPRMAKEFFKFLSVVAIVGGAAGIIELVHRHPIVRYVKEAPSCTETWYDHGTYTRSLVKIRVRRWRSCRTGTSSAPVHSNTKMKYLPPALLALASIACHQPYVSSHVTVTSAPLELEGQPAAIDPCPEGSVLVDGDFCSNAEEVCTRHVDELGRTVPAPADGSLGRCAGFRYPTRCLSAQKVHMRYCIDRYEYPNVKGQIPQSWMSWYEAKSACEGQGKRMCTQSEWAFSCEGPDMKPYPYGDGYHRDRTACNFDNDETGVNVRADRKDLRMLDRFLKPSGSQPRCVSPFGVYDMPGNLDEFVINESGHPYKSGLMGGHVFGVRNACRPMTNGHNEAFSWYETTARCCANAQ